MNFENIDIPSDAARQRFFERVSNGSIALDGVMSPLTRELAGRFGTQSVDMTFGWACTPMDWLCPACGRAKPEIVRLNTNGHLMCRLVEHHDHMKDLVKTNSSVNANCRRPLLLTSLQSALRHGLRR